MAEKKSLVESHSSLLEEWDYEKNEQGPENFTHGSHKNVWWKCSKGHSWNIKISSRAVSKNKCPYCSNKKVGYGNDLLTNHLELCQEWDFEKNKLGPENYTPGSAKKVWWKCSKKHSWSTFIYNRTRYNKGCPYCSNNRVGYGNDLLTNHPELCEEWDYEKNELGPENYTPGSGKKALWVCKRGHSWAAIIHNRANKGHTCPYCAGKLPTKSNSLFVSNPKLCQEWDYQRNRLGPEAFTPSSNRKVWWKCKEGHSWKASVNGRASKNPRGCKYCSNQAVGYGNDLLTNHSDLCKEWDFEKNKLGPENFTPGSAKKVWWRCSKGHSWQSFVFNRVKGMGCPYCTNRKIGYGNDLLTNYPDLCKEWDYEKNQLGPENYVPGSAKKVWWKCFEGHSWSAIVLSRTRNNTNCPKCAETNWVSKPSQKWLDSLGVEQREVKIGPYTVDGFDPQKNTVYEFFGDYWHGNPKIDKYWVGKNAHNGKSFHQLYQDTKRRIFRLEKMGYKIVCIWEHDFYKTE